MLWASSYVACLSVASTLVSLFCVFCLHHRGSIFDIFHFGFSLGPVELPGIWYQLPHQMPQTRTRSERIALCFIYFLVRVLLLSISSCLLSVLACLPHHDQRHELCTYYSNCCATTVPRWCSKTALLAFIINATATCQQVPPGVCVVCWYLQVLYLEVRIRAHEYV